MNTLSILICLALFCCYVTSYPHRLSPTRLLSGLHSGPLGLVEDLIDPFGSRRGPYGSHNSYGSNHYSRGGGHHYGESGLRHRETDIRTRETDYGNRGSDSRYGESGYGSYGSGYGTGFGPRYRRSNPTSAETGHKPIKSPEKMLNFVRRQKAEQCVQRMICHLSFKENFFGDDGIKFSQRLKLIDALANDKDIRIYREARKFGLRNSDPNVCTERYPKCEFSPQEILKVGLRLTNGLGKN